MRTILGLMIVIGVGAWMLPGGCPPAATNTGDNTGGGGTAESIAEFLPSAITLDIGELPEDADQGAAKAQTESGAPNIFERAVRSSATVVHRFQRLADAGLGLGAVICDDLASPDQTQVQGTFTIGGTEVAYKADFAAFDFDGDGTPDGSGNARDLPIAVRIWVDRGTVYERFLCALITQRPTADNLGAGSFVVNPNALDARTPADVQIHVDFDRTDAAHKWNVAYVTGPIHPLYGLTAGVGRVDVRTNAAGDIEKTVRIAADFTDNPYGFEGFQGSAHYLVGGEGLLLSATATGTSAEFTFTNICVDLVDRILAMNGECSSLDTQDMTFLDVPTGDEASFPADFPAQPTF